MSCPCRLLFICLLDLQSFWILLWQRWEIRRGNESLSWGHVLKTLFLLPPSLVQGHFPGMWFSSPSCPKWRCMWSEEGSFQLWVSLNSPHRIHSPGCLWRLHFVLVHRFSSPGRWSKEEVDHGLYQMAFMCHHRSFWSSVRTQLWLQSQSTWTSSATSTASTPHLLHKIYQHPAWYSLLEPLTSKAEHLTCHWSMRYCSTHLNLCRTQMEV